MHDAFYINGAIFDRVLAVTAAAGTRGTWVWHGATSSLGEHSDTRKGARQSNQRGALRLISTTSKPNS